MSAYPVQLPVELFDGLKAQLRAEIVAELREEFAESQREFLTVPEAARRLGVSAKRLYVLKPPGLVSWEGRRLVHWPTLSDWLLDR